MDGKVSENSSKYICVVVPGKECYTCVEEPKDFTVLAFFDLLSTLGKYPA